MLAAFLKCRNTGSSGLSPSPRCLLRHSLPFSCPWRLIFQGITVNFVLVYVMPEEARAAAIHDVNAAIETGALRPFIGHCFALPNSQPRMTRRTRAKSSVISSLMWRTEAEAQWRIPAQSMRRTRSGKSGDSSSKRDPQLTLRRS